MSYPPISPRTRYALREQLSGWDGWILRDIDDLFQAEGFAPVPLDEPLGGERRSRAQEYLQGFDESSQDHRRRLARVAERVLDSLDEPDDPDLMRLLKRDGYSRDAADGRIRPSTDTTILDLPTELLHDDAAIRQELDRIVRSWDSDAGQVISAAKALVEATCKLILERTRAGTSDLGDSPTVPKLVDAALRALDLHPRQLNHSDWDEGVVRASQRVLGGMATVVGGLAELRNLAGADHGRAQPVRVPARWGHLAAGAAATMCRMLLETLEDRQSSS